MRVLLISANKEEIYMRTWPVGLACVAAAVRRAGHDVELLDMMDSRNSKSLIEDSIRSFLPELIGISVRNIDDQKMEKPVFLLEQSKEVAQTCKTFSDAPIVLGGAGYSMFPESALEYVGADMGIQGEGELAFPALLEQIEKGTDLSGVPGLYLRGRGARASRTFVKELDRFPLPTPDFLWPSPQADQEFWLAGPDQAWMPHELQLLLDSKHRRLPYSKTLAGSSCAVVKRMGRSWLSSVLFCRQHL